MPNHIVIDARIRQSSTGRYIYRLVEALQDIDTTNAYTVLVQPDDDWKMRSPTFRTLPCPFPQFSVNPLHELRFAWLLYRLKPDLVHFAMTQQPLLYFGNIVTTTHDLTMFTFVRRGTTPKPAFWLKMKLYRFLMWWSHRKTDRIIVPTRTVAHELTAMQPFTKQKLSVTYEAAGIPAGIKPERPADISGDFIMYVGTAFPHKNLETLVTAFDQLHATHPHLKLVLVGKTEKHYTELAEKVQQHPSADAIILTGFLSDEVVAWLYQHCKAYVFPSLSEGFGLPPLDAMTYGAPVVSSNASCLPEIYGDAAHYFNPHDAADIAAKVSEVLDNPKLAGKLRAAGATQVKKYSWHTMAEETLDVYQDVLAPKNPAKEPNFQE